MPDPRPDLRFRLLPPAWCGLLCALVSPSLAAQSSPTPCSAPEYRQFDFWIGTWDVSGPTGNAVGSNRIDSLLGGCVLQEHWTGAGGNIGESYNLYDASRGVWHQTWVDNAGSLLQLEGGLHDGAMILKGKTTAADGTDTQHRITWSKMDSAGNQVRQHWESSTDGGASWSTAFNGLYVRRGSS